MTQSTRGFVPVVVAGLLLAAPPAARGQATDQLSPFQTAVACAPPPTTTTLASASMHVIGTQDTVPRSLFGAGDLIILDGGTAKGVLLNQVYFVRRPVTTGRDSSATAQRSVLTTAWIRIVAANETTAIATVEHVCSWIEVGDYLEPFTAPDAPEQKAQIDRPGELDFNALGRILFGANERAMGSVGEFMLVDLGPDRSSVPGARFAIYRDVQMAMSTTRTAGQGSQLPLSPVGEGVIVATGPTRSVLQIVEARDSVQVGDFIVPRRR